MANEKYFRLTVDIQLSNPDPDGPDYHTPTEEDARELVRIALQCIKNDGYEGPVGFDKALVFKEAPPFSPEFTLKD